MNTQGPMVQRSIVGRRAALVDVMAAEFHGSLKELAAVNWSAVARMIGVHPSAISHTLHGRRKSRRIRHAIAAAVGLPLETIWPHRKAQPKI